MRKRTLYILIIALPVLISCNKYLDVKSDQKLAEPSVLADFQAMLDVSNITDCSTPGILDLGCDEYYLDYAKYQAGTPIERNCYVWASDIWNGQSGYDWNYLYSNIYIANVVMEKLNDFNDRNNETLNKIYGHALFIRAYSHYFLEETFGQPYKPTSAGKDLGVPLKLTSNPGSKAVRSTVSECYGQIIKDFREALKLLPDNGTPKNRPGKSAVYAMLARVYLTMQDYTNAGNCADSSIRLYGSLYDYNNITVTSTTSRPFPAPPNDFAEILYSAYQVAYAFLIMSYTNIDLNFYQLYDDNDLRKSIFFRKNSSTNTWYFRGNYSGSTLTRFSGLAVDENYLIRAEAYARTGRITEAMNDLNYLLSFRWKKVNGVSTYVNQTAANSREALTKILAERRKELLFRGIRWIDLRRLNQESDFQVTLTRNLNGESYTLAPNDPKYTFPIPPDEIQISGIEQNAR